MEELLFQYNSPPEAEKTFLTLLFILIIVIYFLFIHEQLSVKSMS